MRARCRCSGCCDVAAVPPLQQSHASHISQHRFTWALLGGGISIFAPDKHSSVVDTANKKATLQSTNAKDLIYVLKEQRDHQHHSKTPPDIQLPILSLQTKGQPLKPGMQDWNQDQEHQCFHLIFDGGALSWCGSHLICLTFKRINYWLRI